MFLVGLQSALLVQILHNIKLITAFTLQITDRIQSTFFMLLGKNTKIPGLFRVHFILH